MQNMPIVKSKRHSKHIGQLGEAVVCNMLSRSGFEVMLVDHVGIDVVASRLDVGRIGISVKSRTRDTKKHEHRSVTLFNIQDANLEEACQDFALEPWVAIYVETETGADLYLTSLENLRAKYAVNKQLSAIRWQMSKKSKLNYSLDSDVKHLRVTFAQNNWFP